jgi:hypothetical protein
MKFNKQCTFGPAGVVFKLIAPQIYRPAYDYRPLQCAAQRVWSGITAHVALSYPPIRLRFDLGPGGCTLLGHSVDMGQLLLLP